MYRSVHVYNGYVAYSQWQLKWAMEADRKKKDAHVLLHNQATVIICFIYVL